jgi:pimeloyl-ACP methyl ester carboxylesterase
MTRLLETQVFGEASVQPTLLIVHGLFGAGRNWRALARNLSKDRRVVTVDMRNHGNSFWDASNSYFDLAGDLTRVIETLDGPVDVLGHSMGGKAAMVLATQNAGLVNRLIVADIAPVAYAHSQISNIDLMRAVPIETLSRRSEADQIMSGRVSDASVRAFLLQSLVISPEGNRWELNLDGLEGNMSEIVGFPEISGQFDGPCLFLRGGVSDYVLDRHRPAIEALFPCAEIESLDGAGHWLHAEAPRAFLASVGAFLERS